MTYEEAVAYLFNVGQELRGVKFDLANVARLLEEIGHPERTWPAVHIAGTNGKGSVAAMVEAILRAAGHRTGLYTSPHLLRINERVRVAGAEISDQDFAACTGCVVAAVEALLAHHSLPHHPSFFECLTAIAFHHFRQSGCDIAVLEAGMGGRLDATNVVRPLVSALTTIGFDHEAWLGHTLEQIAFEKAGIIKPGVPVVAAPQDPEAAEVIRRAAAERGAPLVEMTPEKVKQLTSGFEIGLRGEHQRTNAAVALAAVEALRAEGWSLPENAVREGIASVRWPGRLEWFEGRPGALLDGAHNPAGARALDAYLKSELEGRRLVLIFGAMRDKAVAEMADLLFPRFAAVVLTRPAQRRAATTGALAEQAGHLNPSVVECETSAAALHKARALAGPDGVIVVAGSLYLVGEIRALLR